MSESIQRDKIFDALRRSMWAFAWSHSLGDFAEVASAMEMWGDTSWDPAYKFDFDEVFSSAEYKIRPAMLLAAQFVRTTLGDRITGALEFANALQHASEDETFAPDFLLPFHDTRQSGEAKP